MHHSTTMMGGGSHYSSAPYHHLAMNYGGSPRTAFHQPPTSSPFVQFSGRTIDEHNNTLQRLEEQIRAIAQSLADLEGQEQEDRMRAFNVSEQLRGEEEEVIRRQHLVGQNSQSLEGRIAEEERTRSHGLILHEDEMRDYLGEERALVELEEELKRMQASIEDRLYHSREQLRIFQKELDDGMAILERDRHAVRAIASRANEQINVSRRTAEVIRSLSPNRGPRSPVPPSSSFSNGGSYFHANSAVAAANSVSSSFQQRSEANLSMTRASGIPVSPLGASTSVGGKLEFRTVSPNRERNYNGGGSSYMVSSPAGDRGGLRSPTKPGRHNRIMAESQTNDVGMSAIKSRSLGGAGHTENVSSTYYSHAPQLTDRPSSWGGASNNSSSFLPSIHQNTSAGMGNVSSRSHGFGGGAGSALLEACSRIPVDAQEVTNILRSDQNAVNELDQVDNTPLHILCMNERPSLDAVHALLLSGASTTAKNAAGFTPFHCACLNVRGDVDNVPSTTSRHQLKKFLIFKGAQNPNQRTGKGETALHLCAEDDKYLPVVEFLIGAGVDPHVTALLSSGGSSRRMKALDVAKLGGARASRIASYLASIE